MKATSGMRWRRVSDGFQTAAGGPGTCAGYRDVSCRLCFCLPGEGLLFRVKQRAVPL